MTMAIDNSDNDMPAGERALRWIGDLDHPFYDDERNRFVWYEASAIAFQLFLFANVTLVGAMLWLGGAGALRYAGALLIVNGSVAIVAVSYGKAKFSEYTPTKGDFRSVRMRVYLALVLFMTGGLVRAFVDGEGGLSSTEVSDVFSYIGGAVFGLGIVFGVGFAVKPNTAPPM